MNWVDGLIIVMVGLGIVSGYRRGAVMQVFSWGGFIVGLIVGAIAATRITRAVSPSPNAQTVLVLGIWFGTAFVIEALVAFAGVKVTRKMTALRAKQVDAAVGSALAAVLALLGAWLLSAPAKQSPQVAPAIKRSAIMRGIYRVLPPPPNIVAAIGSFLNATGFPEVFAQLNPSLAPSVDPPPDSLANNAKIRAAAKLTFKIESTGCGGKVDGSGFPVTADTIVTAAHVVAGTRGTVVMEPADGGGHHYRATVVYIDTNRDIAVLRVPDLPAKRLVVLDQPASRGTDGAAIGYPGGGNRKITVARVRVRTTARGRDIYSQRLVNREIYVLRASVRQGNSGGPLVDESGRARGMIFAASAQNSEESYALAETEVERAVRNADGKTRQVDTRRCAI